MRITCPSPSLVRSRAKRRASTLRAGALALTFGVFAAVPAQASGPTERMVQLLASVDNPDYLVLRYALAAEGYLFSRDGGRTFEASCSTAIDKSLTRLYSSGVTGAAPTLLDGQNRVVLGQIDGLWSDDGTGCTWSNDPALKDKWVASLLNDPQEPAELLAVVTTNLSDAQDNPTQTTGDLLRRDATGKWTTVAPLIAPEPKLFTLAGRLIGTKTANGSRLYITMNQTRGSFDAPERWSVLVSDDRGKTWRDSGALPEAQHNLTLLGVDPLDPKRLLAVRQTNSMGDVLLLSTDEGATFTEYATIGTAIAAVFGAKGELYVGDSAAFTATKGGVWSAPRLGEPLTRIPDTSEVVCLGTAPEPGKLRVCQGPTFGLLDIASGAFEALQGFKDVKELLDCSSAGVDTKQVCESQLNAGPSWCCTGHWPETEFCGQYDISMVRGNTVYCGLEGRRYDADNRGPGVDAGMSMSGRDGGVSDAGRTPPRDAGSAQANPKGDAGADAATADGSDDEVDAPKAQSKDDGCAIAPGSSSDSAPLSALASLSVLLLALVRARARRQR
jgi:hypothetical protein